MKNNWFWAHRRNSSLHHMSFLMHGLSGDDWMPVVNFHFDNQIVLGVPGKGCYIFYDKNQLSSNNKYKDIQESIDRNKDFILDFRQKSDDLFGALLLNSQKIKENNLRLLSNKELYNLYENFIKSQLRAPIITVQLWGIEACLDDNYIIIKFLKKKLKELGKEKEFQKYRELISLNIGETVAFTEQKDFLRIAVVLNKSKIKKLFKDRRIVLVKDILKREYEIEYNMILKHIKKYEWVNIEYVGGAWTEEKWLELFKVTLFDNIKPREKLEKLINNFNNLNYKKNKAIKELDPPKKVLHAINCLSELIAQRDWAKGYFSRSLLSYSELLDELSRRMNLEKKYILVYSYLEITDFLLNNKKLSAKEIEKRLLGGFVILIKNGKLSVLSGKKEIDDIIKKEELEVPFGEVEEKSIIKGLPASKGEIKGIARVIENASEISNFNKGDILITYMTTMEFTPFFRKASAVVTDEGGMSCHAAIISREFGIPCIVGTKIATRSVKNGDKIEVDANQGIVKIIKKL